MPYSTSARSRAGRAFRLRWRAVCASTRPRPRCASACGPARTPSPGRWDRTANCADLAAEHCNGFGNGLLTHLRPGRNLRMPYPALFMLPRASAGGCSIRAAFDAPVAHLRSAPIHRGAKIPIASGFRSTCGGVRRSGDLCASGARGCGAIGSRLRKCWPRLVGAPERRLRRQRSRTDAASQVGTMIGRGLFTSGAVDAAVAR